MGQELIVHQAGQVAVSTAYNLNDLHQIGKVFAQSGLFGDIREASQAMVKVMAGQELGIPPVASMMGIHLVKGKATLGAHLIASRMRAHGYDYRVAVLNNAGCELEILSKVESGRRLVLGTSSFTEQDAKAAGVFCEMYKKYPRNMYFARAMSNGAKFYTPEILNGLPILTPEEMGAPVDGDGNVVETAGTQAAADAVAQQKIADARAARAAQAAPTGPVGQAAPEKPAPANFAQLKAFREMKGRIGSDAYYRVLGSNGVEHANEFQTRDAATKAWKEMEQVLKAQQEAHREQQQMSDAAEPEPTEPIGTQEVHFGDVIDDSDIPVELGGTYEAPPSAEAEQRKERVRGRATA